MFSQEPITLIHVHSSTSLTLDLFLNRSAQAAEGLDSSWQFFVQHYQNNETQAFRDPNYTYRLSNGSYHIGPNPPVGAEP